MSRRQPVADRSSVRLARWSPGAVLPAVIALAVLLALTANRYGCHRDERRQPRWWLLAGAVVGLST